MESFPHTRLVVVGATGSGKSTLAERLSQKLNLMSKIFQTDGLIDLFNINQPFASRINTFFDTVDVTQQLSA